MCSQSIDLNNLEQLNQVKQIINNNSQAVYVILDRFPFHQLEEISLINLEVIRSIGDLITLFINHGSATPEIQRVMKFYHRVIQYHNNTEENNISFLNESLKTYLLCFKWGNKFTNKYIANDINKLVFDIVTKQDVPNEIIETAIEIFINIIIKLDVNKCKRSLQDYAIGIYDATPNNFTKLRLSFELLCCIQYESIIDINKIFQYIIEYVPFFDTIGNMESFVYIIERLKSFYETCKDETVLQELSVNLAINNFPEVKTNVEDELLITQMKDILRWKITYIFKKTPWINETASLTDIINNLSPTFSIVIDSHQEFKFVFYYLKLVYNGVECGDRNSITKEILQRYTNDVPEQNPCLLKCIYLLWTAYADITEEFPQINSIALSLIANPNLEDFLTYHISQLVWLLSFGNRRLKLNVLTLFIKNYKEESHLIRCLNKTENQISLLDIFQFNKDKEFRIKALHLLKKCTSLKKRLLMLLQLFANPDFSMDAYEVFIEADITFTIYSASSNLDPKLKSYTIIVINKLINFICDPEITITLNCNAKIIEHLQRLCWSVRNDKEAVKTFLLPAFFKRLIELIRIEHTNLKSCCLELLTLILQAQNGHDLVMMEEIELQSINMERNDRLICFTSRLLKCILRMNASRNVNIKLSYLGLYHCLLDAITSKYGNEVVELLTSFMQKERNCLMSMTNILFIKMRIKEGLIHDMFIKYLIRWLTFVHKEYFRVFPYQDIILYLNYLKTNNYSNIRYLNKLQYLCKNFQYLNF